LTFGGSFHHAKNTTISAKNRHIVSTRNFVIAVIRPYSATRAAAFAVYARTGADGPLAAHSIHVLALDDDMISTLTLFVPPTGPRLFDAFGLPLSL
jgi:hypothetical protein